MRRTRSFDPSRVWFVAVLVAGLFTAGCKKHPPTPGWTHKPEEFDLQAWGKACGENVVHTPGGSDLWQGDFPGHIGATCSLDWTDADRKKLLSISVQVSQIEPGHDDELAAVRTRGLASLYGEVPDAVRTAIEVMVSQDDTGVRRVGNFAVIRTDVDAHSNEHEAITVEWDPHHLRTR